MDRNNHGYYEWIEITMVQTFTPYLVLYLKWMCVPPSPKGVSSQCALLRYEYWLNDEY